MTNKQIIIDGIDVCRCRYYDDRYGYCDACKDDIDGNSYTKCMYEDNCYYKQLKHIEQTLDYREKTYLTNLNNLADEAKFLREKLHSKEQECEELKNFHISLVGVKECEIKELLKLKQTLAEIREIAEEYQKEYLVNNGVFLLCNQILQKINEVENE